MEKLIVLLNSTGNYVLNFSKMYHKIQGFYYWKSRSQIIQGQITKGEIVVDFFFCLIFAVIGYFASIIIEWILFIHVHCHETILKMPYELVMEWTIAW